MKKTLLTSILCAFTLISFGQKYMTQTGKIKFFSKAKLENIEAVNNQVSSVLDSATGGMAFTLLMKAFVFEKDLMKEHFNEKYVESDKFPKATFKGNIENFNKIVLTDKAQSVVIKGKLTIHGETKDVEVTGTLLRNKEGKIVAHATFSINLDDYKIKIPSAVKDNISKTIEITVDMQYEAFK